MSKRRYTHIKEMETQIISMREAGMSRQEIADALGLEKTQIKNWVNRYNREKTMLGRDWYPNPKDIHGIRRLPAQRIMKERKSL